MAKSTSLAVAPREDSSAVVNRKRVRRSAADVNHVLAPVSTVCHLNQLGRVAFTVLALTQTTTLAKAPGVQESLVCQGQSERATAFNFLDLDRQIFEGYELHSLGDLLLVLAIVSCLHDLLQDHSKPALVGQAVHEQLAVRYPSLEDLITQLLQIDHVVVLELTLARLSCSHALLCEPKLILRSKPLLLQLVHPVDHRVGFVNQQLEQLLLGLWILELHLEAFLHDFFFKMVSFDIWKGCVQVDLAHKAQHELDLDLF